MQPRLQQMSIHHRDRLASETTEERKARLQQMRDRLVSETNRGSVVGMNILRTREAYFYAV